mgnify:CR=1 FL=1
MNKIHDIVAKSNGKKLIDHTNEVVSNVKKLTTKLTIDKNDIDILVLSAILHDIGKIRNKTQNFFKKNIQDKYTFPHNIIGWYFIIKYVDHKDKNKISNLVLWHHANNNSCEDLQKKLFEIEQEITEDEIALMKEFCQHYNINTKDDNFNSFQNKTSFYEVDNLYRSILITSDVYASSGGSVDNIFTKKPMSLFDVDSNFINSDRTKKQLKIINNIVDNSTTLIKAPTGFGKSMMGILWAMSRTKQVVWVCPTNIISESIYDDIINNLKLLKININIELYITGERKKANNDLDDFSSDIIITNIDNFIKPSVSNEYGSRSLMIYDCDLIFDEVHEYENMRTALFAAYNGIMDKRHNLLNSTTLMLTATEPTFRFKQLGSNKDINILPDKNNHFKAVHQEMYQLFFHNDIPKKLMKGEFVSFHHTVEDVQNNYIAYNGQKLISHGRYLENDKLYRKQLVLDNYKKGGKRKKFGVFTNQILTTSCDYSVKKIFIKAPSVKVFQQSIGRLNRWGGMGLCEIHVSIKKSKADGVVIGGETKNSVENIYQEFFIKELRGKFENIKFTLDDMYMFLNNFNKKHKKLRDEISRQNNYESQKMLKFVFPKKHKKNNDIKVANSNKLRRSSSSGEMYIMVKCKNSNEWVTLPINVNNKVRIGNKFDENQKTFNKQVKILRKVKGYNKHKKIRASDLKDNSIYYDTPYPVFNYVYDEELGLLKNKK